MRKIYKQQSYNFDCNAPVSIDNTVAMPINDDELFEEPQISQEQILKQQQLEKEAEERKFYEAVNAEVTRIIDLRKVEIEQERNRIIDHAQKTALSMITDAKAYTLAVLERATR